MIRRHKWPGSDRLSPSGKFVEGDHEIHERHLHGHAEGPHFHDVEASFAAFDLADPRLGLADAFGKLILGQPRTLPSIPQVTQEDLVLLREDRFVHVAPAPSGPKPKVFLGIVENRLVGTTVALSPSDQPGRGST